MFDYLQQFNKLPKDLRDKISAPDIMICVNELESKYQVDLAMTIMKVMVSSLAIKNLPTFFISEYGLSFDKAEALTAELKAKIFIVAADYLGLTSEIKAINLDKDIQLFIKEAGLTLASEILVSRLRNILATYIRGVRTKIDVRATLAKDVKIGGLNLTEAEIDHVLKICDTQKMISNPVSEVKKQTQSFSVLPSAKLDKIISNTDSSSVTVSGEYNLKTALASGQVKPLTGGIKQASINESRVIVNEGRIATKEDFAAKLNKLDLKHELVAPEPQLDFPIQKPQLDLPTPQLNVSKIVKVPGPLVVENVLSMPTPPVPPSQSKPQSQSQLQSQSEPLAQSLAQSKIQSVGAKDETGIPSIKNTLSAQPKNITQIKPQPDIQPTLAKRSAPPPVSGRPQMHDIKPMPKIIGPIEELQFLDLVNFRRLGATPAEISTKILAKIKLLEKDGYDKMILGVKAWRQSPVNHSYLRLGQDALNKGMTLKDYVLSQKKAGVDCLSLEEIEAMVKLNTQLIF